MHSRALIIKNILDNDYNQGKKENSIIEQKNKYEILLHLNRTWYIHQRISYDQKQERVALQIKTHSSPKATKVILTSLCLLTCRCRSIKANT